MSDLWVLPAQLCAAGALACAPAPSEPLPPPLAQPRCIAPLHNTSGAAARNWICEHNSDMSVSVLLPRYVVRSWLDIRSSGIPTIVRVDVIHTDTPSYSCGLSGCTWYVPFRVPPGIHEMQWCPVEANGQEQPHLCSDVWRWLSL